jgi:hypothetical protein
MWIFSSIPNGVVRTVKSWKGVLIIWFFTLLLVSALAVPLKGSLKSGLGKSMITERLSEGIDVETLVDLGAGMKSLFSSFASGFFFLLVLAFLMNTFLTGGLFSSLKGEPQRFSASKFFRSSAENFWPFLIISLVSISLIIFQALIIIIIPVSIVIGSDSVTEHEIFKSIIITCSISGFVMLILLLVADYARAWQVAQPGTAGFKAIGFGFRETFSTFFSSFPLMLLVVIIQLLFGLLVFEILPSWRPSTGGGVLLLFLVSQIFFIIKIMLRTLRYASVTSLMQQRFMTDIILTP